MDSIQEVLQRYTDPSIIITELAHKMEASGMTIEEVITDKPWGAMVRFSKSDAAQFKELFFDHLELDLLKNGDICTALSPKLLVVKPHARLSWQYHNRRAEYWTFLTSAQYMLSESNNMPETPEEAKRESYIYIKPKERHRLIGGNGVTIVAEIWQHSDKNNPSDEKDIVRVQDDYRRS